MAGPRHQWRREDSQYEHQSSFLGNNYDPGGESTPGHHVRNQLVADQDMLLYTSSDRGSPAQQLGEPAKKKLLHRMHAMTAALSIACFALAVASVANETLPWRLGRRNYQLIVLGFLLSIMNLCLASVATPFFLLLEARFGPSTLQNYEGILRNKTFSSRLSFVWRFVLLVNLGLPLGLSIAYKTFGGGESRMIVNATKYNGNASYYGMSAPPGLQLLGAKTGTSLFSNATLSFAVSTSSQTGPEPIPPIGTQAYGFNILSISNDTTAMLDMPEPSYVSNVQSLLASGESWTITAGMLVTVATHNHSRERDFEGFANYFEMVCKAAEASSGAKTHMTAHDAFSVNLIDWPSPGNQSLQYIALAPDPGLEHNPSCENLTDWAQPYDATRQLCEGTWSITRGGIQLIGGSCNTSMLLPDLQQVITNNTLFLGVWYMASLVEFLGPFAAASARNESKWTGRYFATGVAAMLWYKITILNGAAALDDKPPLERRFSNLSYEDAGLIYPVQDQVVYSRPTLQKSPILYFVLLIQPLLTVVILALFALFHSTPMGKDFGLISILAGVDRGYLDILRGAALSGQLLRNVQLVMWPEEGRESTDDGRSRIKYFCQELNPTQSRMRQQTHKGKLRPGTVYY